VREAAFVVDSSDLAKLRIDRGSRLSGGAGRRAAWIVGIVAVVAVAVAIAFVLFRTRAIVVRVTRSEMRGGGAGGGLTANGYVVARTKASISSKIAGRLARLEVEEGDHVRPGQVIGWLDDAEYRAAIRQAEGNVLNAQAATIEAEARLDQANRDLERAEALYGDSLVALVTVQDAKTAVAATSAQLRAARARVQAAEAAKDVAQASLENTRIRAPFDGTVLRKDAEVGEVVAPSVAGGGLTRGAVVTMADLATLEVEVDVNESYIGEVGEGQPANIVLDAYPTVTYDGHVRQIVPTADRQKATVLVRVAFDSADGRVLPEMAGRVVFRGADDASSASTPPRVVIVADAVRSEGGADWVWVIEDGRVSRRQIDAGPVSAGEREVRSGLRGGETLVLEPPAGLTEGAKVKVAGT
jgi:RND family efflux transporter MFP subunit